MEAPTQADLKKMMTAKAIIRDTDMIPEMQVEVQDIIISGVENNTGQTGFNAEAGAKYIKENLDRKFGPSWHCVIGEGYAVDVTMQKKSMMFMFYNGNLATLVFKS